MNERQLISYLKRRFEAPANLVSAWMAEDAEVVEIGDPNRYLLVSVDTSSEKADFPSDAPPFEMGYFSTALSLSDIAACGGKPFGILVSCSIPNQFWGRMKEIYDGINTAANDAGTFLLGGDTNSGAELSLSVVSLGFVDKEKILKRKSARLGDLVGVTGELGRFNLGVSQYRNSKGVDYDFMLRQGAPVKEGLVLCGSGFVTSCIDLPDGLSKALLDNMPNERGFLIDDLAIPIDTFKGILGRNNVLSNYDLASNPAGDVELLFTANGDSKEILETMFANERLKLSWIGKVVEGSGIKLLQDGQISSPSIDGFTHSFEGKQLFA